MNFMTTDDLTLQLSSFGFEISLSVLMGATREQAQKFSELPFAGEKITELWNRLDSVSPCTKKQMRKMVAGRQNGGLSPSEAEDCITSVHLCNIHRIYVAA